MCGGAELKPELPAKMHLLHFTVSPRSLNYNTSTLGRSDVSAVRLQVSVS